MSEPYLPAVSLFSGAGGLDRGFHEAGFQVVEAVEMDPEACQVFRLNYPGVPLHEGRVEDWLALQTEPRPLACIFGGPPCQPFSSAGKGRGHYDARDGIPHFIAAVRKLRPETFVLENVQGLTFKKHRKYLGQVLEDLQDLGYQLHHRVLNASHYGVPQHRHRLFIVGLHENYRHHRWRWPKVTHGDPKQIRRAEDSLFDVGDDRLPWVTVRQALGLAIHHRPNRDIADGRPESSWVMDERPATAVPALFKPFEVPVEEEAEANVRRHRGRSQVRPDSSVDEPAPAVLADPPSGRSGLYIAQRVPGGYEEVDADAPRYGDFVVTDKHPASMLDEPAMTISSGGDGHSAHHHLIEHPGSLALEDWDAPSPTVRAQSGSNGGNPPYLAMDNGYNRTDPVELDEPSRSITSHMAKEGGQVEEYLPGAAKRKGVRTRADRIAEGTLSPEEAYGREAGGLHKGERVLDPDAPTPAIQGPGGADFIATEETMGEPSPTITSGAAGSSSHHQGGAEPIFNAKRHGFYRRLTWQECARLQCLHVLTWPEEGLKEGQLSKSALHRLIGNAVPPPLAAAVAKSVLEVLL